ncbi:hypothetical protein TNCV_422261 [Trichonephila clavipes]|nr:hypothetical protein TNCV_422261 [Trichonephila clavipes]
MNQPFASVDTHNSRIWSLENPHEVLELQRDSPKLNVFVPYLGGKWLRGASDREMCRSKGGDQRKTCLPSANNFTVTYPGQTILDKNIDERLSTAYFRAASYCWKCRYRV